MPTTQQQMATQLSDDSTSSPMDIASEQINNTPIMDNATPPTLEATSPKPRKKRVAIHSPESTPPQPTTCTAMEVDIPGVSIQPTVLSHRFQEHQLQNHMTPDQVKASIASDQWKAIWEHPQIMEELTTEPVPPTPAEVIPYEFDEDDSTTMATLQTLNGRQLEHAM